MAITETRSFCRACGSNCGIIVETDGDSVVRVKGDRDHPLTAGYTCSKGRELPQIHHHPNRLEVPQIREGGRLRNVSWDEALDDLAAKLKKIIDESGPRAVGFFFGGGGFTDTAGFLMMRTMPAALKSPSVYSDTTIDVISKLIVSEMMAGIPGMMSRPDFARCKLFVYVGTNPLVSHGHTGMLASPAARIREMTQCAEVWVVDPRRSETAERATRHLAPRAGTDYAILAYCIRELLRDGADEAYLRDHAQDVDRLRDVVERFTLGRASNTSGLTHAQLQDFLAAIRRAGRLCVDTGTGISMSPAANVTQWMAWALMIVTGSLDREGGAWMNPGYLSQIDKAEIPPAPETGWPEPGPESRPELRAIAGEYPCAAMADEIEAGHLRALINFGGELVACLPHTDRTLPALRNLDVLVTSEVRETPTTEISTHIFPATDQFERADLSLGTDTLYPCVAAQFSPPAVKPVGARKGQWWMGAQIAKRLGIDLIPGIDPDTATDEDVMALVASQSRGSLDEIKKNILAIDAQVEIGWLQKYVDEKIGGWRLAPQPLVDQLGKMEPPAPLVLIPRRQRNHANSRFLHMGDMPCILLNAEDTAEAGLNDGDLVIVRSQNGSLTGVTRIDPTLIRGVMTVPHGWAGEHNVNLLTGTMDVDPLTGMPRYSGLPVTLQRCPNEVPRAPAE